VAAIASAVAENAANGEEAAGGIGLSLARLYGRPMSWLCARVGRPALRE